MPSFCFDSCRFVNETTSCRTWVGGGARFNTLTFFIFQVKNLKMLGSKTQQQAHD
jgi:hypothetical protein